MVRRSPFFFVFYAAAFLAGCGGGASSDKADGKGGDPSVKAKAVIVCSTAVIADLTRRVAGDHAVIRCLFPAGESPATHDLSPAAAMMLHGADLALINGLGLEASIEEAIQHGLPAERIVRLAEQGAIKPLADGQGRPIPDVWLGPGGARQYVTGIRDALTSRSPEQAAAFAAGADGELRAIQRVEQQVRAELATIPEARRHIAVDQPAMKYWGEDFQFTVALLPRLSGKSLLTQADAAALDQAVRRAAAPALFYDTTGRAELIELVQDVATAAGANVALSLPRVIDNAATGAGAYEDSMLATARALIEALAQKSK